MSNTYSVHLGGSADAFSATDHADFKPTGDFTIGAWIKTSTTGTIMNILQSYSTDNGFLLRVDSAANKGYFYVNDGGAGFSCVTTAAVTDGTWHWIVATRSGTTIKIYDNASVGGTTLSTAISYNATNYVRIGSRNSTGTDSQFFNGNLDEVFMINGTAWDQTKITAMYNQYLTGETNLKAYYQFENNANDSTAGAHTLTPIGSPTYVYAIPFGEITTQNTLSTYLGGTADAYSIVDHNDLKPTGNFTVGGWVKSSSVANTPPIFQSYSANTNVAGFYIDIETNGTIAFLSGKNTGVTQHTDWDSTLSTATVNDGNWHCVVCVWDGSYLRIYVDGSASGTPTSWANAPTYAATNYIRLGCGNKTGSNVQWLNGNIDEVFLINGTAWNASTVASYYKGYITGATNLKAYYQFQGNGKDLTGNAHTAGEIGLPIYQLDVPFTLSSSSGTIRTLLGVGR